MKAQKIQIMAAFLLLSGGMYAQQTDAREKVNFGLKAGGNYSNVWDERDDDFEAYGKFGFAAGTYLNIPIGRYLGIQPEILFSQKGFQGSGSFLGSPYTYSVTTNHLDIPIMLQVKPAPFMSIVAGPQYSYLLSQQRDFTSDFYSESDFDREDTDIRRNMLGITVGADFYVDHFSISPRVSWDVIQNHDDGSASSPRYKNQLIQLTLGYRFY